MNHLCKKNCVTIVVDEVTTGVGRTGKWFGYMHYSIMPDIVCMGKGLGNGYPISAIAMEKEVAKKAVVSNFHYAQSHQNDSLGCRVAYEVLSKIEKNHILDDVEEKARCLVQGYQKLNEKIPFIKEIRNRGLLFCVELSSDVSENDMMIIEREMFEKGFIIAVKPAQKVIRTYCPFVLTTEMIHQYLDALEATMKTVIYSQEKE